MAPMSRQANVAAALALGFLGYAVYRSSVYVLDERDRSLTSTMPRASSTSARPMATAMSTAKEPGPVEIGRFRGTFLRLTDELGKAELEVSNLNERGAQGLLNQHWRRHHSPFAGPGGERGRFVQAVSLTLRHGEERTYLDDRNKEKPAEDLERAKVRNSQVFGLGEGSFDERESLVFPTPTVVRFPVRLPKQAVLRFSPAVLGDASVTFSISFRDAQSKSSTTLLSKTIQGPSNHWTDVEVDLSHLPPEGKLELSTTSDAQVPSIGLWGSPVIVAPSSTKLPYNVLFIIVDAMRGDAVAASHDLETDERIGKAPLAPLDARFAAMPEVAPELNRLAQNGIIWQNAWSAAMWTRPSTMAMLSGKWPSHLGLSVMHLELQPTERRRFYSSRPPMISRVFRDAGANTVALVNNMYLSGSVGVGLDYAFETLVDHRYAALDTRFITNDALTYLDAHQNERFFLLLNYASPHSPHAPPTPHLEAIQRAKGLPTDSRVKAYLGEIHKDDAAIGQVLRRLELLHLTENTLVIVTADHGETMSAAHDWVATDVAQGAPSGRYTHLSTMWEEAARIVMILSLPGKLPKGLVSKAPVQSLDLVPSILELEGLPVPDGLDGRSLVPRASGAVLAERPIVIEGRGAKSIQIDHYRLVVREPIARRLRAGRQEFTKEVELYDHARDPGERNDVARLYPDIVARLRKRLEAYRSEVAPVSMAKAVSKYHVRFALGGQSGTVKVRVFPRGAGTEHARVEVSSTALDARAIRRDGASVWVTFDGAKTEVIALQIDVFGENTELGWELGFNGKPWPADRIYGGALGMRLANANDGLGKAIDRVRLESKTLPHIASGNEFGLFVTREPVDGPLEVETNGAAQLEAEQAMQAWGYARKTPKKP